MNSSGMRRAFAYRFKNTMQGFGIFAGAMLVISLALVLGFVALLSGGQAGGFMFFGFAAAVTAFVMGICTIREDLRLFIQHGIGRRTTFVVEVLNVAATSVLLAIAGDLMITLGQVAAAGNSLVLVSDFYQMFYLNDTVGAVMALPDHVMNVLFLALLFCAAQAVGMFISLGYYHLNKTWTVIVSIAVPLLLMFGPSALVLGFGADADIEAKIDAWADSSAFIAADPWSGFVWLVATAAVFFLFDWLLMRRVAILPAKVG